MNRTADREAKLLQMRTRRAQVDAKLKAWEDSHRRPDGQPAGDAERQQSSQYAALKKLASDLDAFIRSLEADDPSLVPPVAGGTMEAEQRAERGRIKSRMRQWDRRFERMNGRKPGEGDRADSPEYSELLRTLRDVSSAALESEHAPADTGHRGGVEEGGSSLGSGTGWTAVLSTALGDGEYARAVLSRVANGTRPLKLEDASMEEVREAAVAFAQYDVDRDGVVGPQDFKIVINSLAQYVGKPLEPAAEERMFSLADVDGNGAIDFPEFMGLYSQLRNR